jgi:hypothetical protein
MQRPDLPCSVHAFVFFENPSHVGRLETSAGVIGGRPKRVGSGPDSIKSSSATINLIGKSSMPTN